MIHIHYVITDEEYPEGAISIVDCRPCQNRLDGGKDPKYTKRRQTLVFHGTSLEECRRRAHADLVHVMLGLQVRKTHPGQNLIFRLTTDGEPE